MGPPRAGITALLVCQCTRINPHIGEAENFIVLFRLRYDVLKDFDSKTAHYLSPDKLFTYHQNLAFEYFETIRKKFDYSTRLVLKAA